MMTDFNLIAAVSSNKAGMDTVFDSQGSTVPFVLTGGLFMLLRNIFMLAVLQLNGVPPTHMMAQTHTQQQEPGHERIHIILVNYLKRPVAS